MTLFFICSFSRVQYNKKKIIANNIKCNRKYGKSLE